MSSSTSSQSPESVPSSPEFARRSDQADPSDTATAAPILDQELSEQQLRQRYENEEIERFLHLFSAYVTEVRLPEAPIERKQGVPNSSPKVNDEGNIADDEGWMSVGAFEEKLDTEVSVNPPAQCISEKIAYKFLVPILPPPPLGPPAFTIGRLRLTTQRLYLSIQPVYAPFFANLSQLATWKDRRKSAVYCMVFWMLWYQNLLLPALFLRIFYSLACRRIFPYPSLAQLRAHRREIVRAEEFGEEIQARLTASSAFGMKEMWRLFRVFNKNNKNKAKRVAKQNVKPKSAVNSADEHEEPSPEGLKPETATVLDDPKESKDEQDVKRSILNALSEVADLHERVKNIFIWRKPAASRVYGSVIFFLFLVTLVLPAKYLAKLTYFVGGVFFWHIVPIVAALPPAERSRLPPAFSDVPTDADYAMELISQRVAAGLDVTPPRKPKSNKKKQDKTSTIPDADPAVLDDSTAPTASKDEDQGIDWKKWGERAALGKAWADDGKRLISGGKWPQNPAWPPRSPIMPTTAIAIGQPEVPVETHTFPAQHTSAPGLITLTPAMVYFTPIMAAKAKLAIPLSDLRGVKKIGVLKGISIRWCYTHDSVTEEKEERFGWVGSRDELFARLIGSDGKKWLKA